MSNVNSKSCTKGTQLARLWSKNDGVIRSALKRQGTALHRI